MISNKKWIEIKVSKKDTDTKDTGAMRLTYTAWQTAWKLLMETYSNAKVVVVTRQDTNGNVLEFHGNDSIGYCVFVRLQIEEIGFDFIERLAILDNANNPQKIADYEFTNAKGRVVKVAGLCIDDICNTIQRCTVKAIARAGIGLNVYEGDFTDIKTEYNIAKEPIEQVVQQPAVQNNINDFTNKLNNVKILADINALGKELFDNKNLTDNERNERKKLIWGKKQTFKINERDLKTIQGLISDAELSAEYFCTKHNMKALTELNYKQWFEVKKECEKAINDMN